MHKYTEKQRVIRIGQHAELILFFLLYHNNGHDCGNGKNEHDYCNYREHAHIFIIADMLVFGK